MLSITRRVLIRIPKTFTEQNSIIWKCPLDYVSNNGKNIDRHRVINKPFPLTEKNRWADYASLSFQLLWLHKFPTITHRGPQHLLQLLRQLGHPTQWLVCHFLMCYQKLCSNL